MLLQRGDEVKTYYIILEGEELRGWQDAGSNDIKLSDWKATLTSVYQHLHLFEQPQQALNYAESLVSAAMSTTTVPVNQPLHMVAVNIYPHVVLQPNVLHVYQRSGSNYKELENHSDSLRNMNGLATPTVIITGCNYNDIAQTLTPRYFERHLVDTLIIHGDLHADVTSLQHMINRGATNDRATKFIQKVGPDYMHLLQDETTATEETTGGPTASSSKKKGVRTTIISSDYDMEIVKHVKRV